nr:CAZy families GH115 protein [uncultured bacterium]
MGALLLASAPAATVALTADDALGSSSFSAAGNWSDAAAPSSANDYVTGAYMLRTPADTGNKVFAGASLTLQGSGLVSNATNPGALLYKGTSNQTINFANLISDGGQIRNAANTAGTLVNLTGNLTVASNGLTIPRLKGTSA